MKKVFRYFTMMLAIGGATLTSCLDKEEIVNNQKEQYQDNWVKVFGNIDPDHDWSVAKQVNATFNLAGVVSGEHTARIYTEQPGHKRCKLLAELTLNGTGNVSFNIEKVSEEVFIRVTDADGKTAFDGYFTIEGNQLTADSRTIASRGLARDAASGTQLNNATVKDLGTVYRSGTNEYNEFYNVGQDSGEQAVALGDIYVFDESQATNRVTYNFKDSIYPIVSRNGGVFAEQTDNRHKMTQGVEYVTSQAGKVSLTYVYGATALYNAFGYYYWEDGKSASDAKRIVLINDARPHKILKTANSRETTWDNATTLGHSMKIDNDIRDNESNVPNYIIGSKYDLVYYGPNYDQAGTYEFPANVHIGFFIYTTYWKKVITTDDNGQTIGEGMAFGTPNDNVSPLTSSNSDYLKTLMYSIPDHNKAILEYQNYRTSIEKNQGSNTGNPQLGEVSAVTYQYQGRKYLGFEDGVDKDMNDLIFLVEANIEVEGADNAFVDRDENYEPEVEPNSWIIACEDLGSVGDYDFNDAVFSVSHVGGSTTLKVTPLAAGGTFPIEVLYDGKNISDEGADFHKLINSGATVTNELYKPINAYSRGTAGKPITIEGVPTDYDINNHGFTVKVTKNPNEGPITITAPEHKEVKAPQMLVLPGNWVWPIENKNIHSGYPQFANWTNDQDANKEWYKNPVQDDGWLVDKPSAGEDEPGQGGTGGSGSATPIVKTLPVYNGDSKIGDINVEGGEWNYYIQIPAEQITNNGATITFTGANKNGNNIEIKLDGQQKAHTSTNVMTISDASQLSGKAFGLYFWMNADSFNKITSIVIDNTGNGNSGTEEPETPTIKCYVDGVEKGNLQTGTDDFKKIYIPIEYFTGNNGATITFTSTTIINPEGITSSGLGGTQGNNNQNIDIKNNILEISADDVTYRKNNGRTNFEIFLPLNSDYGISEIRIVNKNKETEEENYEVSGFTGEKIGEHIIYTIPVLDTYKAENVTGIKVTVTLTSAKGSNVAFSDSKDSYNYNVTGGSATSIEAGKSHTFEISKEKYNSLSYIYTRTDDKEAKIASISIEVVNKESGTGSGGGDENTTGKPGQSIACTIDSNDKSFATINIADIPKTGISGIKITIKVKDIIEWSNVIVDTNKNYENQIGSLSNIKDLPDNSGDIDIPLEKINNINGKTTLYIWVQKGSTDTATIDTISVTTY